MHQFGEDEEFPHAVGAKPAAKNDRICRAAPRVGGGRTVPPLRELSDDPPRFLDSGDVVRIGTFEFEFEPDELHERR